MNSSDDFLSFWGVCDEFAAELLELFLRAGDLVTCFADGRELFFEIFKLRIELGDGVVRIIEHFLVLISPRLCFVRLKDYDFLIELLKAGVRLLDFTEFKLSLLTFLLHDFHFIIRVGFVFSDEFIELFF